MKKLHGFWMFVVSLALVACGGGGGSAGTLANSGGGGTDTSALNIAVQMLDAAGAEVINRTVPPDTKRSILVKVTDAKGVAVNNVVVKIAVKQDANFVVVSGANSGLTSGGSITFLVEMSGERKNGAATLDITAEQGTTIATKSFAVQTAGGTGVGVASSGLSVGLTLVDQSGVEIASRTISQTGTQSLRVSIKDEANQPQPFSYVTLTFSSGAGLVKVVGSSDSKLTDASGVAQFALAPSSVASSGAVQANVAAVSGAVSASGTFAMQIAPGNVVLGTVAVAPASVQRGSTTLVTVPVLLNGVTAPSNSVSVDFSSTCGVVTPATALVGTGGIAQATVQTNQRGPDCKVTATASGANTVLGSFAVTDPPVSALRFVQADPPVIYQSNSPGSTSSLVTFRLVDTVGDVVSGRSINATLSNADGGIVFCDATPQSTISPAKVTNADGEVTFAVCSGTLPTTLVVKASLNLINGESSPVETISNILTVQTGLPSQRFFDISATALNIYAGAGQAVEGGVQKGTSYFSGKSTDITVYLADRLANPVPDGTPVVFVAEGGQINSSNVSSCLLKDGGCTVKLIGQEFRPWGSGELGADPRPGRVTVLAYADGQEAFTDANRNNRYDAGEPHEELGRPYIDLDENNVFKSDAITQLVRGGSVLEQSFPLPTGVEGTDACLMDSSAGVDIGLSVENTCNRKWDELTKVRRKITIVFSGGEIGIPSGDGTACVDGTGDRAFNSRIPCADRTRILVASAGFMSARISDANGNPLPADATLGYSVTPTIDGCEVTPLVTGSYGNTTEPITMAAALKGCSGGALQFQVTVDGKTTSFAQPVP
ncbi:MAG: hypothetical protein Q8S32_16210 [Burkholderiaceae bacterium]|nr:hypothetical protein [Burkholderiaceae bacterium]